MKRTEKGFSLIELSIVLIIIGLLVAGITGGTSLVRSATVRAVMSEANSYNAAVNAYYARFSALPGDDRNASIRDNTLLDGDGNGRISYRAMYWGNSQTALFEEVDFEGVYAWKHLASAGIIEGNFTSITSSFIAKPGEVIPASKLSGAGWAMDFKNNMNMLLLSSPVSASSSNASSNAVISGESAHSIDTKMDDGSPIQGKIRSYNGYNGIIQGDTTGCINTAGTGYTDIKTPVCYTGFALSL